MASEPSMDLDQDGMEDFSAGDPTITFTLTIVRICLAIFGLLANTVCGVVLTNKKLWSPTSMLLLSLVAYDAIFLLATLAPTITQLTVKENDKDVMAVQLGLFYPMRYMAQTGSIYTTVTVTIERFLIVLRPLKARVFCTFGKTRKVVIAIFILSVLFNIPRCFFAHLVMSFASMQNIFNTLNNVTFSANQTTANLTSIYSLVNSTNSEALNESIARLKDRQFYVWLYFRVYEGYVTCVFFYLLPYLLIPILNLQLLLAIKKRREETRRISVKNEHQLKNSKPTDLEDGLTMIVLGITVCFFICCLIPAIYNVARLVEVQQDTALGSYLLTTSDTMLCVNASTDFFFYCLLGRRFRNIFLQLFCPKKYLKKSRTMTGSHHKASHRHSADTCYHSV